jgi:hypothetical protein
MPEVTLCCHLGYFDVVLLLLLSVAIDYLFIGKAQNPTPQFSWNGTLNLEHFIVGTPVNLHDKTW